VTFRTAMPTITIKTHVILHDSEELGSDITNNVALTANVPREFVTIVISDGLTIINGGDLIDRHHPPENPVAYVEMLTLKDQLDVQQRIKLSAELSEMLAARGIGSGGVQISFPEVDGQHMAVNGKLLDPPVQRARRATVIAGQHLDEKQLKRLRIGVVALSILSSVLLCRKLMIRGA